VQAVERGARAGFDMIELHAAHGYLLSSFITPLQNRASWKGLIGRFRTEHHRAEVDAVYYTWSFRTLVDSLRGEMLDAAGVEEFERAGASGTDVLTSDEQQAAVQALEDGCEAVATPLQRLEHALHPWVTFAVMPVFALTNAGVALDSDLSAALMSSLSLGVIAGLVIGKQVGVTLFAWLAVRSRLAAMPASMTWRQVYGASWLAGIGFTMSLFIASLAFGDSALLSTAKVGILTASLIAGIAGWIILRWATQPIQTRE